MKNLTFDAWGMSAYKKLANDVFGWPWTFQRQGMTFPGFDPFAFGKVRKLSCLLMRNQFPLGYKTPIHSVLYLYHIEHRMGV